MSRLLACLPKQTKTSNGKTDNTLLLDDDESSPSSSSCSSSIVDIVQLGFTDEELAAQLQFELNEEMANLSLDVEIVDKACAEDLQQRLAEDDMNYLASRLVGEEQALQASIAGKSLRFVTELMSIMDKIKSQRNVLTDNNTVKIIAKDDLVFLTQQLLNQQSAFAAANLPTKLDLGYHFTSEKNMIAFVRMDY